MIEYKEKRVAKEWTIEEEKLLEKYISEEVQFSDIAKILGRTRQSCAMKSSRLGLISSIIGSKKYTVNENFWKEPNPINCYYAGILASDGHIALGKSKSEKFKFSGTLALVIHKNDLCTLEGLKESSNYSGPIIFPKDKNVCSLRVYCKEWNEDLITKFNIAPLKTYRIKPPNNISDQLFFCWLIGYIDGDGTFYIRKNGNDFTIKILSCSQYIINYIYDFMIARFPQRLSPKHTCRPFKRNGSNCWELRFTGIKATCISAYLRQYNVPKLARKWAKQSILELEEKRRLSHPHFFDFSHLPPPV